MYLLKWQGMSSVASLLFLLFSDINTAVITNQIIYALVDQQMALANYA